MNTFEEHSSGILSRNTFLWKHFLPEKTFNKICNLRSALADKQSTNLGAETDDAKGFQVMGKDSLPKNISGYTVQGSHLHAEFEALEQESNEIRRGQKFWSRIALNSA